MPWCIIIGCGNNLKATKQHEKDVSYHIFPKNTQRRNAWMNNIKQPFKFNADTSYVCSKHFVPDDFECNSLKEQLLNIKVKRQLKRTAIPSINLSNASEEEKLTNEVNNPDASLQFNNKYDVQKCCAVSSCNSIMYSGSDEPNQMNNSKIMFHKFPTDTVILEKWLKFCNNYKTISDEYQNFQICSEHFNKDNYENKYTNESSYPIKVLKKDAVPTLNGGIMNEDIKNFEDELSRTERKKLVDKLLADYEEQQKNEKGHLNGMVTKYPGFFSPKINSNAKLGDKLKLLKSIDNPITYPPSKKKKVSTAPNLNTEHLESPFINRLTQEINQNIQVTHVKGGLMLHALPQITNNVSNTHLDKTIPDEEEEIIIVTEDEASHIDLSSYEEEVKGNNTEVVIVTDSKETKNTPKHIRCVSINNLIHKIDSDNKCEKLLKNNESLCTPLNTDKGSLSQDKGCQVIIPCKGCENRSLKINKLLRERTRLLNDLNQNGSWKDPDEINTLKRMNGVLSLLLLQCVSEKNGKKSPSIRVDLVQDSIERINRGWSMQDTSETLCQALSVNAYDEFSRAFEMINEI
ncbi:uncharacterized protein LOC132921323 [Rhopalosiphum padi]|uniref:uncharacterized protein LOC132921323 n=1 Tax=Rhopalosiphum padi TaxID=40932 RepID=UPI00298EC50D|nr:uncharacterized protein LOC132921323 [Rhopalosiphum padi]XP_060840267.1 uncharacterized protein LOC132921323 [Rhopalosiphum padi]XP_060840269.1 uncharacterized protein LOC132921323 [Rhopalosiphum padi]XP_060840270.1 uncharacterized protein LOC132921323 [Rhopalosiphum padi]